MYTNMTICLLQIEFSPLRQYTYVPVTKSQKIEGKYCCRLKSEVTSWLTTNGDLVRVCSIVTDMCSPHRCVWFNGAEAETDRPGWCPTSPRQSPKQVLCSEGDEGDGQLHVPRTCQPMSARNLQQPTVQHYRGICAGVCLYCMYMRLLMVKPLAWRHACRIMTMTIVILIVL